MSITSTAGPTSALNVGYDVSTSLQQSGHTNINTDLFNRFPDELIITVFDFCDVRERIVAAMTCWRWRRISLTYRQLWTNLHVSSAMRHDEASASGRPLQSVLSAWKTVDPRLPELVVHRPGTVEALLRRARSRTVNIFVSLLKTPPPNYGATLRAVLLKNIRRIAQVNVLFEDHVDLVTFEIWPSSDIVARIPSLRLLHVEDPEFVAAGLTRQNNAEVQLLPSDGHDRLYHIQTSCVHSWELVLPSSYPRLQSLSIHIFDIHDLRAAMQACPQLESLTLYISGSLDGEALESQDVPTSLDCVYMLGLYVDQTCQPALSTFAEQAREVIVDCAVFWAGVSTLFSLSIFEDFKHITSHPGMQTVYAKDKEGVRREVTAKIADEDIYQWIDFYRDVFPAVMHLDYGKKILQQPLPFLCDLDEQDSASTEDGLTWYNDLLVALDDS